MGAWATASLFIISILCLDCKAYRVDFQQNQQNLLGNYGHQLHFAGPEVSELQSASDVQSPNMLRLSSTNYRLGNVNHDQTFQHENSYEKFDENNFERNLEQMQLQTFAGLEDDDDRSELGLGDHVLTDIQSGNYHEKVGVYDDGYSRHHHHDHHEKEKHEEVHYHKHEHHHKHEHKQEHKHEHKQEHEHKHKHEQHHKHEHHQEHKHGHKHKHDHHQEHKHGHHHGHKHHAHHDHKHENHHDHKHGHKHGHKHEHHNEHKHQHKHGHKHIKHHHHH